MKKTLLLAALLMGAVFAQAQKAMLSPSAAMKAVEIRDGKCQEEYVHGFATLVDGADLKALDAYGVKVNSLVGNMATVYIPAKRFGEFVSSGLCSYFDLGQEMQPYNDLIRDDLGIDYIHNGINLPQGYDGTGVVVGVIDIGLNYGHPSFYDTTGTALRIKRVWQQLDPSGNPPAGFTYGTELTTPEEMLAAVTDRVNQGHGSHVTGIAAGCGAPDGNGKRYRGMAPAADIVMVGTTMYDDGIFDGIRYIHEYARSVGKPCVINMSLGTIITPHDGTDPLSRMIDGYMNGGTLDSIVLVASAGNDGGSNRHLHHHFSPVDTVVKAYTKFVAQSNYDLTVDCWGGANNRFSLKVTMHDRVVSTNEITVVDETPFISSAVDSVYTFDFTSPRGEVYTCQVVVAHTNPYNQRPEIMVSVQKYGLGNMSDIFSLTIKSDSADVHCWSAEQEFCSYNDPQFVEGDFEYTLGGVGTNGNAVISVGSYTTRTKRVSESGAVSSLTNSEERGLSFFTSRGPTVDGRVKPDICAPGEYIVSVFSTPYIPYYPASLMFDSTVYNGETYYYCLMRGTSMASPAATGVVALWLQQNPSLSVSAVRSILHSTARKDDHTGDISDAGDNNWGWGKINPFGGLPNTTVPMHYVDVTVDNDNQGVVTGNGCHPEGFVTIAATAFNGYAFSSWDDGNTDNPRIVNLTSDTAFVAYFDVADCDTVTQYPWNIEFVESLMNCWDTYSAIGGATWSLLASAMISGASSGSSDVDNWLVSPYLIPEANTSVTATFINLSTDSVAIVVITEAGDTAVLANEEIVSGARSEIAADLTPYAGQPVRFAFHHFATAMPSMVMLMSAKVDYLLGIDGVTGLDYKLLVVDGSIQVSGAEGMKVGVYDIMGRQVANNNLPNGVYIVRVGDLPARKVVVMR